MRAHSEPLATLARFDPAAFAFDAAPTSSKVLTVVGDGDVTLSAVWGEVRVALEPLGVSKALAASDQELLLRVVSELRYGLEVASPEVLRVVAWLDDALGGFDFEFPRSRFEAFSFDARADALARRLEEAVHTGRVRLSLRREASLTERRPLDLPVLDPLPPLRESTSTFFELRLVDETGQAIGAVDVELASAGAQHQLTTNAAGVALLDDAQSSSASAGVPDPTSLEKALAQRWQRPRTSQHKKEGNTQEVVFDGAPIAALPLKPVVPNTLLLKPLLGELFLELRDKSGRVLHAGAAYTISGPETFSGTTDEAGRLRHAPVFPGDYLLELTVQVTRGEDQRSDTYQSALVVLPGTAAQPEVRLLGAVPFSVLAHLKFFFDTDKTFLLPTALPGLRQLRKLYLQNNPSELLVVGHADTAGSVDHNDQLSLARAESVIAFLKDDVDAWLKFYEASVPSKQRWGAAEDRRMLISAPGFEIKPKGERGLHWFQRTRTLQVDGKAGPETRRQLITEYMGLDGASLGELGFDINATAHGCGEHFPLDETGEQLDAAPADEQPDANDRRVELFFFDPEFGIFPEPPGKNSGAGSTQYPAWRQSAIEEHLLVADSGAGPKTTFIELVDALFRTNSAVVMPEGEAPSDSGQHAALTSMSVIGTALRFNAENMGKTLLVAGHTDTTASVEFNQKLSEERARATLALLLGGEDQRQVFMSVSHARHTVSDYKQILGWVSRAFAALGFDCDPGKIDDNAATGAEPVRRFQRAYNGNKAELGATGADLVVDGVVGPLVWGAFFDCYEAALRDELGESAEDLQALRDKLVFADDERRALGFSEHFPIEGLGVDNFKSQTNRRVEILFFDEREVPDLEHAEAEPATTELYLPGTYSRTPVPIRPADDLRPGTLRIFLLDEQYQRMPDTAYELRLKDGVREGASDASGLVTETDVVPAGSCELLWATQTARAPADPELPIEQRFPETEPEFRFRTTLNLKPAPFATDAALLTEAELRLSNLGYVTRPFQERYGQFRSDYGRAPSKQLDRAGFDDLATVHGAGLEAPLRERTELDPELEPQLTEEDGGTGSPLEFELRLASGEPARDVKFTVSRDGRVIREGALDAAGRASLTDLPPDTYDVTFPELDAESFEEEA